MFRRKKLMSSNQEVQEAMEVRDELLGKIGEAVATVDRLQSELVLEYVEAENQRQDRWR